MDPPWTSEASPWKADIQRTTHPPLFTFESPLPDHCALGVTTTRHQIVDLHSLHILKIMTENITSHANQDAICVCAMPLCLCGCVATSPPTCIMCKQ